MNISAVILTKNEEKNIADCIGALSFCDEIIVVDDNSTDRTTKIAEKLGTRVFSRSLDADFASQRNFGLERARARWVLFVDADERVSPNSAKEIIERISSDDYIKGFYIKRIDFIWGKEIKYGEAGRASFLRLARKGAGKWKRRIHEVWEIVGKCSKLRYPLLHQPHPSLSEFIRELNWMSTLHAKANKKEGKSSSLAKIIFWPIGKFLNNYFMDLGILDGTYGFVIALFMSFHSFLAWGKLWLEENKVLSQSY